MPRTGTYLTIRKFSREALTLDDLIRFGSLSEAAREFLEICVRLRKNILIAGESGCSYSRSDRGYCHDGSVQANFLTLPSQVTLCHPLPLCRYLPYWE